jgi:hypothetical protein
LLLLLLLHMLLLHLLLLHMLLLHMLLLHLLLLHLLLLHLQLSQFALALQGSEDGLGLDELGVGGGNALLLHLLEPLLGVSKQRWAPGARWTPRVGVGDGIAAVIADGIEDRGLGTRQKDEETRHTM